MSTCPYIVRQLVCILHPTVRELDVHLARHEDCACIQQVNVFLFRIAVFNHAIDMSIQGTDLDRCICFSSLMRRMTYILSS